MKNQKSKIKNQKFCRGFTLVELLVAMAVFSIVVVVVSSIFINVINAQRKNINNQDILDNGRFILESVGRAIRQSDVETVDGSSPSLTLDHPVKGVIIYTLNNGRMYENGVELSSKSVYIDRLNFAVLGNSVTDNLQPRVTISISMRNGTQKPLTNANINLQTTITPRNLQIQQ